MRNMVPFFAVQRRASGSEVFSSVGRQSVRGFLRQPGPNFKNNEAIFVNGKYRAWQ
jgi:hypothetical protein